MSAAALAARAVAEADLDGALGISPTPEGEQEGGPGDDDWGAGVLGGEGSEDGVDDGTVPPSPSLLSARWSRPAPTM